MWPHMKSSLHCSNVALELNIFKIRKVCFSPSGKNDLVETAAVPLGRHHFEHTGVYVHLTSIILANRLQDAVSWATFSMIWDTDAFRCQPSITHRILTGNRFDQMRAVSSRPRGFHEDMALSHSKS